MKATIISLIASALIPAGVSAQTISDVLAGVERNNTELRAIRQGNDASDLETRQQNVLEDLSVEYSPFFNKHASGIASS